jgi:hypothetical protein
MKRIFVAIVVLVVAAVTFAVWKLILPSRTKVLNTSTMILASPSFQNDNFLPKKFTCDGGGINPELEIQNAPTEAKSLALILHDPDAPVDGGFIPLEAAIASVGSKNVPPQSLSLKNSQEITADRDLPLTGFYHWVVWNIDPGTTLIKEESVPSGSVDGSNSSGKIGWVAPCPPSGPVHHYEFYLYALDATLNLPEGSTAEQLQTAMKGHILAETKLVGLYQK